MYPRQEDMKAIRVRGDFYIGHNRLGETLDIIRLSLLRDSG